MNANLRRITPIPISLPLSHPSFPEIVGSAADKSPPISAPNQPSRPGWFWCELTEKWVETEEHQEQRRKEKEVLAKKDEKRNINEEKQATTSEFSGFSRSTIGETTISSEQAEMIRDEVRSALRNIFPGIAQTGTLSTLQ